MEEQPQTLQLSPNPDPHHHHRVLLYGLTACFLIIIAGGAGYLWSINAKQGEIPANKIDYPTTQATPPVTIPLNLQNTQVTPSASIDSSSWQTISNAKDNYSFKVPSTYKEVQGNPFGPDKTAVTDPSSIVRNVIIGYDTRPSDKVILPCTTDQELFQNDSNIVADNYKTNPDARYVTILATVAGRSVQGIQLNYAPGIITKTYLLCNNGKTMRLLFMITGTNTDPDSTSVLTNEILATVKI